MQVLQQRNGVSSAIGRSSSRKQACVCRAQQKGAQPSQPVSSHAAAPHVDRRSTLAAVVTATLTASSSSSFLQPAQAALPQEKTKVLCDTECEANMDQLELVTLPSGLQYRDMVKGTGATPPVGFQVVVDYVAYTDQGRVFDSSAEKGKPYDIRVGSGQVIPGLDEGLRTMQTGGFRRLYIPGNLAFPQPLKAAAGRPKVPANSPVVFDLKLLYVPGADDEE